MIDDCEMLFLEDLSLFLTHGVSLCDECLGFWKVILINEMQFILRDRNNSRAFLVFILCKNRSAGLESDFSTRHDKESKTNECQPKWIEGKQEQNRLFYALKVNL